MSTVHPKAFNLKIFHHVSHQRRTALLSTEDPSGQYRLDLTLPGPRTSFRLLLSQLSDMGSRSQYIKSRVAESRELGK